MLLLDNPITQLDDDLFSRREFAGHLAEYLSELAKEQSSVVALQGKWGSGKTSLINMTLQKLDEYPNKPIIVNFNPWTCASTDRLVTDYLHALRNGLAKSLFVETARDKVNKALRAIERYAAILAPLDISVQLSGTPLSSAGAARKAASSLRSFMMGEDDVDTCKKKVSDELKYAFENVIVVIDDIDRLPNDRIAYYFSW